MSPLDHAIYAALWLSFGALHSVLAGERAKAAFAPRIGRAYRLAYNLLGLVHVVAVWAIGRFILAVDVEPFDRPTPVFIVQIWLVAIGAIILGMALLGYDRARFLGLAQLKQPDAPEDEPLRIEGLNKHIRHPLYLGAIILLIGLVADPFSAATALWASAYFVVGAKLEERRLLARYGQAYADYAAATPFLLPITKR